METRKTGEKSTKPKSGSLKNTQKQQQTSNRLTKEKGDTNYHIQKFYVITTHHIHIKRILRENTMNKTMPIHLITQLKWTNSLNEKTTKTHTRKYK